MFCKNCGAQIPDGSVFCTECGTRVQEEPVQEPVQEEPVAQEPIQEEPVQPEYVQQEYVPVEQPVYTAEPQPASGDLNDTPILITGILALALCGTGIGGLICGSRGHDGDPLTCKFAKCLIYPQLPRSFAIKIT